MDIDVVNLGVVEYEHALSVQNKLRALRQANRVNDVVLLLEHPPIITLGRKALKSHILASEQELVDKGIKTYVTDRGGDVTYHGPGQIVGYLIFDLSRQGGDVRKFVRNIEEVFIRLLWTQFRIVSDRDPNNAGVWINESKILAIGLSIKRGVSMHGFAFNLSTNLDHFKLIVPCGLKDKDVTSLAQLLGYTPSSNFVISEILSVLSEVFSTNCILHEKEWVYEILSLYQT